MILAAFAILSPKEDKNSSPVTIEGYEGDLMEPFLSRDGEYLFFNNLNEPQVNTNLHFAKKIDAQTFKYEGEVKGVNSEVLDGVASMDTAGNFYFVSIRSYAQDLKTLYTGTYKDGVVSDVHPLENLSPDKAQWLNMDAEISADGIMLYYTENFFNGGQMPRVSDIFIAEKRGEQFYKRADSDEIMKNVNTPKSLEYAPATSSDGLKLFFTRIDDPDSILSLVSGGIGIYVAERSSVTEPFGVPQKLPLGKGFLEAPAISPDGITMYFHKKVGGTYRLFSYSLQ